MNKNKGHSLTIHNISFKPHPKPQECRSVLFAKATLLNPHFHHLNKARDCLLEGRIVTAGVTERECHSLG